MTTELTKAAQQALEALKRIDHADSDRDFLSVLESDDLGSAITAIERALTQRPAAQTEREAVAWPCSGCANHPSNTGDTEKFDRFIASLPAPQQATPASAPQSLLMRLAGIAAECSDPDTTDALDALIAATQQATPALDAVCNNGDCSWGGPLSDCRMLGAVGPLCPECGETVEPCGVTQQATPEPVGEHVGTVVRDTLGRNGRPWLGVTWELGIDLPDGTKLFTRPAPVENEPVGEPVAAWRWFNSNGDQVTNWLDFKPSQKASVDAQVAEAGGRVEYAYTRPAPGVPEDVAGLLCSVADNLNDMPISDEYGAKTAKKAYDLLVKYGLISTPSELLAAQAKGGE